MSRITLAVSCLACALFAGVGAYVASSQSATQDEVPHIGAGLLYLQGDLRFNPEHPPLAKILAALALPARRPALPPPGADASPLAPWSYGSAWLHQAQQPPLELLLRARLPLILLNALLVLLVAAWTQRIAGALAACIAAGLMASSPLWIAHATLVTTDAPATLFFVATCYCASRLLRVEAALRLRYACLLAISLALGLATKYSMLALVGLVPLAAGLDAWRLRAPVLALWALFACVVGAALAITLAWGFPPDPARYLHGVLEVGSNHAPGYKFYAFGTFFHDQDPLYFARALVVKVSLSVLLACLLSPWLARPQLMAAAAEPGGQLSWQLLVPAFGYYLLMSAKAPAIGVRYVLPVLPFMNMLAAVALAGLWRMPCARFWLVPLAVLQVLGLVTALRATPLAFFNGFGCGTGDALPCLDDSNVDWGQALPALRQFRDTRYPGEPVRIFYFGSSPTQAYVPGSEMASPQELRMPVHALYAMSLHLRARCPEQAWPRQLTPSAIVGGAYAIFDLRH